MKNRICPICQEGMLEHNEKQSNKCLQKFIKEATNPVVYASISKMICPICEKDMLDHNSKQVTECVNEFIKEVKGEDD